MSLSASDPSFGGSLAGSFTQQTVGIQPRRAFLDEAREHVRASILDALDGP